MKFTHLLILTIAGLGLVKAYDHTTPSLERRAAALQAEITDTENYLADLNASLASLPIPGTSIGTSPCGTPMIVSQVDDSGVRSAIEACDLEITEKSRELTRIRKTLRERRARL